MNKLITKIYVLKQEIQDNLIYEKILFEEKHNTKTGKYDLVKKIYPVDNKYLVDQGFKRIGRYNCSLDEYINGEEWNNGSFVFWEGETKYEFTYNDFEEKVDETYELQIID